MDATAVAVHSTLIENSSDSMSVQISWGHLVSSTVGLGVVVALTDSQASPRLNGTECTSTGRSPPCFIVREAVSQHKHAHPALKVPFTMKSAKCYTLPWVFWPEFSSVCRSLPQFAKVCFLPQVFLNGHYTGDFQIFTTVKPRPEVIGVNWLASLLKFDHVTRSCSCKDLEILCSGCGGREVMWL